MTAVARIWLPVAAATISLFTITSAVVSAANADEQACFKNVTSPAEYEPIVAACTKIIQTQPVSERLAEAFYYRGAAHVSVRQAARAIPDFDEAVRLDPYYTSAFVLRAHAHEQTGDLKLAIKDRSAVIELSQGPLLHLRHIQRGDLYRKQGDYNSAIADYTEAIRHSPDNVTDARRLRAVSYALKGDLDKAIADYDLFLNVYPEAANSLYARGILRKRNGDASGEADIVRAKAIKPNVEKEFADFPR